MPNKPERAIDELLLEAHQRGVQEAIDRSIRTGVPLVVEENGKIREIKPQYKYVLVPIHSKKGKSTSPKRKLKDNDKTVID